jgi:Flp pilus assembly protein TadG
MKRGKRLSIGEIQRLIRDRDGGVAVMTAMTMTSLLGVAGLGTEATLWYVAQRNLQGAADAAAFTAATAESAKASTTAFDNAAQAVAQQYGYVSGTGGVVVAVNNPPKTGPNTGNSQAVEVLISQPQSMMFSALFMTSQPTISGRAVAAPSGTGGSGGPANCVVALDKGKVTDINDSGTANLNMPTCNLQVNSSSSDALNMSGTAQITAKTVSIVGNYQTSGGANITASGGITTGASVMQDPYASVSIPPYSGCNQTALHVSTGSKSYAATGGTPFVFCNGLSISGSSSVALAPGVYVINAGSLSISGSASLTGTGVTIILTNATTPSSTGSVSISGGTTVNLSAPTSGTTAGLAFFQDRAATGGTNSFSGGSTQTITGAIYLPNEAVSYSGNSGNAPAPCTQLIGFTLNFTGTSDFNANCNGLGLQGMGSTTSAGAVKLIE